MGNHTGKDDHGSTGSPLDFFHTAPTTPTEADLNAMSSKASSDSATPETAGCITPFPTTPIVDWAHKLYTPSEWAIISVDSISSAQTNVSDASTGHTQSVLSLDSPLQLPTSTGSPSEQSWQERDSGLEPQAAAERASEEMTLVLLSLMEHYQTSLGLTPNTDLLSGTVELLRHLITERDELVEEVQTLRAEKEDWHQFQCDMQVAVSVADRLKLESEEALDSLQKKYQTLEEQLTQATSREQAKEKELENLRAEHKDVCCKLSERTLQQQQAEQSCSLGIKDTTVSGSETKRQDSNSKQTEETLNTEGEETEEKTDNEAGLMENGDNPQKSNETSVSLTGKGVAEGYLRSLAALEKKKERASVLKDSKRIVMLSERSWSLSRLPLPAEAPSQNETSVNTSTTLPLCKKEETSKGRRMDHVLQRQDSWSCFYTGKQEEDPDSIKPQDGFTALLRRHGGSRRNSLLRWCQGRTEGYENIDITNFSRSWEDGLAFCALFHTYLPSHIPYESLTPESKGENLELAFKTGESVGIPATVTVEDMLKADGPDWQSVLSYVESIFRHFEM